MKGRDTSHPPPTTTATATAAAAAMVMIDLLLGIDAGRSGTGEVQRAWLERGALAASRAMTGCGGDIVGHDIFRAPLILYISLFSLFFL